MLYPKSVGNQPYGRGVYLVRRILAVLVILLLLALLLPQACQAVLEPRDETDTSTQDTANVVNSGDGESHEEGVSHEETPGVMDDVAEQEDGPKTPSFSSEAGVSEIAPRTFRGLDTSEDEDGGEEHAELQFELDGVADVLEERAVGEVGPIVLTSVADAGGQQAVEPQLSVEPMVPLDLTGSAEPTFTEDLLVIEDTAYLGYSTDYEDPAYYGDWPTYDDLTYYGDSAYYDDLSYYADWAYYSDSTYYGDPAYEGYLAAYDEYLAAYEQYLAAYSEYLAAYYQQQSS
jgi:hypothetical protein